MPRKKKVTEKPMALSLRGAKAGNGRQMIPADNVDAEGTAWATVGENIRKGAKEIPIDDLSELKEDLAAIVGEQLLNTTITEGKYWTYNGHAVIKWYADRNSSYTYERIPIESGKTYYYNDLYAYFCYITDVNGTNVVRISDNTESVMSGTFIPKTDGYLYATAYADNEGNNFFPYPRVYMGKKSMVDKIVDNLTAEIKNLYDEIEKLKGAVEYNGDFNYFAIGNSITWHGKQDYWWNECGMAASVAENDYYHKVVDSLSSKGTVCSYVLNFAQWEMQSHDRAETLILLDKYLSSSLDLVTIQLSENVNDLTTFVTDYNELIAYIKAKAPYAQIIIVGDFWTSSKSEIKRSIAESNNVDFADLTAVYGDDSYKCGKGTTVYGDDGVPHTVEHSGVASHPGDKGMAYIAAQITALIN